MTSRTLLGYVFAFICAAMGASLLFQNCAKVQFSSRGVTGNATQSVPTCDPGFQVVNNVCQPAPCAPNSIAACTVVNGVGQKICNSQGTGYGNCNPTSCAPGYVMMSGLCTPVTTGCSVGSHRDCSTATATGTETCTAAGVYGPCVYTCSPGYLKGPQGNCVPETCAPGTATPCKDGVGSGFQYCTDDGSALGKCVVDSCPKDYVLQNGLCVIATCALNTKSACPIAHGLGVRDCNPNGGGTGPCVPKECDDGFEIDNGACVETHCEPKSVITCYERGGTGTRECHDSGFGYGECQLHSCHGDLELKANTCVTKHPCDDNHKLKCENNHVSCTPKDTDNHERDSHDNDSDKKPSGEDSKDKGHN